MCVQRYLHAWSTIYVLSMLFMCFNVVYSDVPIKRHPPSPCFLFLWNLRTPLYYLSGTPHSPSFHPPIPPPCLSIIPQFHLGVLLEIFCVFSEHLIMGECLYIWSILHIFLYSCNKMFCIYKQRLSYFCIFGFLAAPCLLLTAHL